MKLLLDTHTVIWWINGHSNLSPKALELLEASSNTLYLSVASIWEVAIKTSKGKLPEFDGGVRAFKSKVDELLVHQLYVMPRHVVEVEDLPFIHSDPFDRLLIATAKTDGMTILTADENIHKYDVPTIW